MRLSELIDSYYQKRNECKDVLQETQDILTTLSALYMRYGEMDIDSDLILIDPLWKEKVDAHNLETRGE